MEFVEKLDIIAKLLKKAKNPEELSQDEIGVLTKVAYGVCFNDLSDKELEKIK